MLEFLTDLFDTSGFPARWHCGRWTAAQGWLHILSDLGVWSAYLAIPCVLVYFALRRRDLPFKFVFLLFGAFILACGTTHLMDAVIFWWPAYRLSGVLKLLTALVSWATVFALIRVAPQAFALRSPGEVEREASVRKRMEELANAMPQMVWTARPDGFVDSYNDRWYEYTGSPRDLGGDESWKSVLHPDDVRKCLDAWSAAVRSGGNYEIECRIREQKTGAYRWHLARALPAKDGAGMIVRWVGTSTDIEDQKRAEDGLRQSEEQFRTLVNSIPQLAWVARPDGHVYGYNHRWYEYTGSTPEQMKGWGWQSVHDPNKLPEVMARWQASIATGEPFDMVVPLRGADGRFRSFLTRIVPLLSPEGRVLQWFGTHTDITERIQMEEGLRRAQEELEERVQQRTLELWQATDGVRRDEQRYRALVEATTAIVWNIPPSGAVDADLPAWAAFTGQTQEQIRGWGWLEAVHPEDRTHTANAWNAAVATGSPYRVEYRLRRSDGEYRHTLACGVPILGKDAALVEWAGANTDVTDQRRAEEALRVAKEAAEAANRAKSEFLANMSHEIRTPMNGILGMTELALDTHLTVEQREYLGMVKSSGLSLLTVINDILDFSKIEAGQLELDLAEFEVARTVGGALRTLAVGAQQRSLELACQIAADVPPALVGDAGRLGQVLVNLVGNAVKFTEQGEVVVRVEQEERVGDEVRLHVTIQDTGIGIPLEKQTAIFEAFAQADSSTTRKYGGTGLGLTISAQLVGLMGGRLWVESAPGRGSTFHFTVQLRVGRGSVARKIRISPPKLAGTGALVADDNATNLQILDEVLRRWGMRPTLASGGADALALLERAAAAGTPFPLVLLDAHMPDVDGFAVAALLQASPAHADAAVLMLTSSGRPGDPERCRELGVAAHLLKPVAPGELLEAVVRALHLAPVNENAPALPAVAPEERSSLRILLAEDNPVNQRLAVGLLEKRGHAVVVAADGKQALAALERESFDLILMDVQMPEMGGYEATAHIRAREKQTGGRLPIIAMTAHAMKGDRERCLAHGMDGYVSKPILAADLFQVIDEAPTARNQSRKAPERRPPSVFDRAASLERTGGDEKLLGEMAVLFAAECPKWLQEIREAVARRDAPTLERAAHALRGSVSNFFAATTVAAVKVLETMGRTGNLDGADAAFTALETALQELTPALARLTASGAGPSPSPAGTPR